MIREQIKSIELELEQAIAELKRSGDFDINAPRIRRLYEIQLEVIRHLSLPFLLEWSRKVRK